MSEGKISVLRSAFNDMSRSSAADEVRGERRTRSLYLNCSKLS